MTYILSALLWLITLTLEVNINQSHLHLHCFNLFESQKFTILHSNFISPISFFFAIFLFSIFFYQINECFDCLWQARPGVTGNGCIVLVILLHYFTLTNFCWMLVEGKWILVGNRNKTTKKNSKKQKKINFSHFFCWFSIFVRTLSVHSCGGNIFRRYNSIPNVCVHWLG